MDKTKIEVKCEWCRAPFMARVADRKRGWGRYDSKSCKAKAQAKRTGKGAPTAASTQDDYHELWLDQLHPFSSEALGQE